MKFRAGRKIQVVIVAQKPQKEVLLLQTNKARGQFWQNITGSVGPGETFVEAAHRELLEETQFQTVEKLTSLDLSFEFDHEGRKTHYTEQCFLALLPLASSPQLDPKEHQDFKWISISKISPHYYQHESNFKAYEKARKYLTSLSL